MFILWLLLCALGLVVVSAGMYFLFILFQAWWYFGRK